MGVWKLDPELNDDEELLLSILVTTNLWKELNPDATMEDRRRVVSAVCHVLFG